MIAAATVTYQIKHRRRSKLEEGRELQAQITLQEETSTSWKPTWSLFSTALAGLAASVHCLQGPSLPEADRALANGEPDENCWPERAISSRWFAEKRNGCGSDTGR